MGNKYLFIHHLCKNIQKSIVKIKLNASTTLQLEKETISIKSYKAIEFAQIRAYFGIDFNNFLAEIGAANGEHNYSISKMWFYTASRTFAIQKITKEAKKVLEKNINAFKEFYMQDSNNFLERYLGLYSLQYGKKEEEYYVVRSSPMGLRYPIDEFYDLKGCIDRPGRRLHQIDYDIEWHKKDKKLHVYEGMQDIQERLCKTTSFLHKNNLTNYSIRVGICKRKGDDPALWRMRNFEDDRRKANLVNNDAFDHKYIQANTLERWEEIYVIEIFNTLEEWTWKKSVRDVFNKIQGKNDRPCASPQRYCTRIHKFIMYSFFVERRKFKNRAKASSPNK